MLVVDDNATNRRILDEIRPPGGAAAVVDGGRRAPGDGGAQQAGAFPLVMLDYQMPDMDGFEVAGRMRACGPRGATIMMLSSWAAGDALRCRGWAWPRISAAGPAVRAAGGDPRGWPAPSLVKGPALVTRHTLNEGHRALRAGPAGDNAGDPLLVEGLATTRREDVTQPAPLRSLRVLVAEDNRVNQLVIRRMLERLHHTVVLCEDGRAAVAAVEAERPDLVLMDVQMPEMDGFAATAAIRERERAQRAADGCPSWPLPRSR